LLNTFVANAPIVVNNPGNPPNASINEPTPSVIFEMPLAKEINALSFTILEYNASKEAYILSLAAFQDSA
jgi:hypothetical protein